MDVNVPNVERFVMKAMSGMVVNVQSVESPAINITLSCYTLAQNLYYTLAKMNIMKIVRFVVR